MNSAMSLGFKTIAMRIVGNARILQPHFFIGFIWYRPVLISRYLIGENGGQFLCFSAVTAVIAVAQDGVWFASVPI